MNIEEMYKKYYNSLLHYSISILSNRQEAEEAVDDAFIAVWSKADSYAYIKRAVRFKSIDKLRSHIRRKTFLIGDEWMFPTVVEAPKDDDQVDKFGDLLIALSVLPNKLKLAINDHYFLDKSHKQIAKEHNINVQSSKNAVYRAVQKLTKSLNK